MRGGTAPRCLAVRRPAGGRSALALFFLLADELGLGGGGALDGFLALDGLFDSTLRGGSTEHRTSSGSAMISMPSGTTRSETWSVSFMSSSLTSTTRCSGMAVTRPFTVTSRVDSSSMPPALTPLGSPSKWMADRGLDGLVQADLLEVDVDHGALDAVERELLDDGLVAALLALERDVEDGVHAGARCAAPRGARGARRR